MGTIKKGIMGGFSGKVGNVVGASWNGIDYIRSLPAKVKNPKSPGQVTQRHRFALVGKFMRAIAPVARVGFKGSAEVGNSPYSTAMSYNINHAVKGEYPDFELDFRDVVIARGDLSAPDHVQAACEEGKLNFSWETNPLSNTSEHDRAILVAYNPARQRAVYDMGTGARGDGSAALSLPSAWEGDTVEAFAVFITEDKKRVSDSVYAGSHEVVLV